MQPEENRSKPGYLGLLEGGELRERAEIARDMLKRCSVCPRECGVNRLQGETGFCRTGSKAMVASFHPHHGEEAPLSGYRGSGTIFFSNCNLSCQYCQNYDISQLGLGRECSPSEIADMMLKLQSLGCHNINLVTPSHVVPQIIESIYIAASKGLSIPIVYNTSSYDSLSSLSILEGIVDIYLADLKYTDNSVAERYSRAPGYADIAKDAIREMHRQVGVLKTDGKGIAIRGLMIRHLVLPNGLAGTEGAMRFIAEEISRDTFVNLMSQYRPCYRAMEIPELGRMITPGEFREAIDMLKRCGIGRGEIQPFPGMAFL